MAGAGDEHAVVVDEDGAGDGSDGALAAAIEVLYGAAPEEFVGARKELAAQARRNGNRALAARITALRKPVEAAWVVNLLARARPDAVAHLGGLGEELRAAQARLDGPALRDLGARRQDVVADLLGQARELASGEGRPVSQPVAVQVQQTLLAALADADAQAALASGCLLAPLDPAGLHVPAELPEGVRLLRAPSPAARRRAGRPSEEPPQDAAVPQAASHDEASRDQAAREQAAREEAQRERETVLAAAEAAGRELADAEHEASAATARRDRAVAELSRLLDALEQARAEERDAGRDAERAHARLLRARREAARARDELSRRRKGSAGG